MKVTLDENLPLQIAIELRAQSHDVHTSVEEGLKGGGYRYLLCSISGGRGTALERGRQYRGLLFGVGGQDCRADAPNVSCSRFGARRLVRL